jgi:DNA (cytosine-5)-methyltransferase 1
MGPQSVGLGSFVQEDIPEMKKRQILFAADLFCGAGGTSSGLLAACKANDIDLQLIAINHWDVAIATHQANHAYAKHLCESMDNVDPRKLVPKGRLNVLIAGPECTHHSNARGGRPMNDQSRASAWHILRWAEALYIENILIENVKEFRSWGPLGATGRPIKKLRGQLYLNFIAALKALGYRVEDKVLNAADYGDPTTRERLFIIARRGNRPIVWPRPTHAAPKEASAQAQMFKSDKMKPWRTAREIIDWKLVGKSIFTRKRPLAPKTLDRIAAGLRKFGGANAEPFLLMLYGTGTVRSVDRPLPTVTARGTHVGLIEPFMLGQQSGGSPRSVGDPVPTIATGGAISLIEPFIIGAGGPVYGAKPRSVDQPLNTVMTENHAGVVEPFMLNIDHQSSGDSVRSVDEPVPTITTKARSCLVEPFLVEVAHGNGKEKNGNNRRVASLNQPAKAVTTSNNQGLVEPFLVEYYGTNKANSVHEPLDTVTTKQRFGLVETDHGTFQLDIRFRMLEPHELAAAQGLAGYKFTGNKCDIVRQIGNAVPKGLATSLCAELIQ